MAGETNQTINSNQKLLHNYGKKNKIQYTSQMNDVSGVFTGITKSEFAFDPDRYLEKAYKGEKIEENVIKIICSKVREILSAEDNVQNLKSPITLVGDVHG